APTHTLPPTPYTPNPTPQTPHPPPHTLHPTPYTPHPTPHTLHPTPHTLHPTPYTPHPTLHTLHPTPYITLWLLLPFILFLPWMPVLLQHFSRPETEWFKPFEPTWADNIVPIYQTAIGWLLMVVALPVENQPSWIAVPLVLLMLVFAAWLVWQLGRDLPEAEKVTPLGNEQANPAANPATNRANRARVILTIFTIVVLLEFLAIVYVLGKDITSAVRYHFIYYPSICVLLADRLARSRGSQGIGQNLYRPGFVRVRDLQVNNVPFIGFFDSARDRLRLRSARTVAVKEGSWTGTLFLRKSLNRVNRSLSIVLLTGLTSCVFVLSGLVFQKPYYPGRVARNMNIEPGAPLMVVVGYDSFQEVALGLSFALEMRSLRSEEESRPETAWVFWERSLGYQEIWANLAQMSPMPVTPLYLWVVAPGLRQRDYAKELLLSGETPCRLDPSEHYRVGIPYQLYRCHPEKE
ncbi:MAG: hypothetical protein F6J93_09310, partial [Oscillatoria sp. SIO1A7]|nr:hypothetical protein [Oscillatoria sp. SIO1A7]